MSVPSICPAGIWPGLLDASLDLRLPSISKFWTVPAFRPPAATVGDGAAKAIDCSNRENTKRAAHTKVKPLRVRPCFFNHDPRFMYVFPPATL